ncbi:MAG TPA: hypothetical protein VFA18_22035, partial [Gemmataceae bacterium]|nr:hypothetical protein [Gemmataceae bacterium]
QVKAHKDGTFTIKVETQRPLNVFPGMPLRPATAAPAPPKTGGLARGAAPVKGRGLLQPQQMTSYNGLEVLDAKGKPLPISHAEIKTPTGLRNQWTQQVTLTLKPDQGQGAPAKLTFTGFRMATVTVPFNLAEVPVW